MTADPNANGGLSRRGAPLIDGIEKVTGRARYTADLDHRAHSPDAFSEVR